MTKAVLRLGLNYKLKRQEGEVLVAQWSGVAKLRWGEWGEETEKKKEKENEEVTEKGGIRGEEQG